MKKDIKTFYAGANLTDKEGYAVKKDGNKDTLSNTSKVVLAAAGERADGILVQDGALAFAEGDKVGVATEGTVYAIAGDVIDEDDELAVGTGGKLVKATAGDYVVAVADEAAAADGDRVQVQLKTYLLPST